MDCGTGAPVTLPFPHLFLSLPSVEAEPGDWDSAFMDELHLQGRSGVQPGAPLRSLFVAAGPRGGDAALATRVHGLVGTERLGADTEWTIELRMSPSAPAVSLDAVRQWWREGVSRVSLSGPFHWACGDRCPDLEAALSVLRAGGIGRVNVDLPFGGARATEAESAGSPEGEIVGALTRWGATELSLHEEDATEDEKGRDAPAEGPGAAERAAGMVGEGDSEPTLFPWRRWRSALGSWRYRSADGVHFWRRGAPALYSRALLRREPVLGLGPSAMTFRNPMRRRNVPDWRVYLDRIREGALPLAWEEWLRREEVRTERVWTRLREDRGLRLRGLGPGALHQVERWVQEGWAVCVEGRVILREEGWARSDSLSVDLLAATARDRSTRRRGR